MRRVSSALTLEVPLMKAETVAMETPADRATSIIVGALDLPSCRLFSLIFRNVLPTCP
jgi:hypothetical protein